MAASQPFGTLPSPACKHPHTGRDGGEVAWRWRKSWCTGKPRSPPDASGADTRDVGGIRVRTFLAPPPPPLALALPAPKPAASMLCTVRRPPSTTRTLDARSGAARAVWERSAAAGAPPSAAPPAPPSILRCRPERAACARSMGCGLRRRTAIRVRWVRHCTLSGQPARVLTARLKPYRTRSAVRAAQRRGECCAGGDGRQSHTTVQVGAVTHLVGTPPIHAA